MNIIYAVLIQLSDPRVAAQLVEYYESVGLRAPYIPKYFDRAEHHQTARGSSRMCCAPQALLLWAPSPRRRVRAIVKCVTQKEVHGKRRRGRPKSNMTPRSGNIAQWMAENVEEIMRDSWDRAIDGGSGCCMGG